MPFGWAAAATVAGAYLTSSAASDAADSQANSTREGLAANDRALAQSQRQFDITQANERPFRESGVRALGQFESDSNGNVGQPSFNFDASQVRMDPGYEFGRAQGEQALDRRIAASGGRISGAALKEAAQYGTDYAATGYNAAYNRQYGAATDAYNRENTARGDRLNRLAALARIGQTSNQQISQAGQQNSQSGQQNANTAANLIGAQGNAAGAAQIAQGNIWGNAGNQLAAAYGRYSDRNKAPNYAGTYDNATGLPSYALIN